MSPSGKTFALGLPKADTVRQLILTAGSISGAAEASSPTGNSASHKAESFDRTADSSNPTDKLASRVLGAFDRTAEPSSHIPKPSSRTGKPSSRTVKLSSHTVKSFNRTNKSFRGAVRGPKDAKNGKTRPFCPSRRMGWSKNDSSPFIPNPQPPTLDREI